MEAEGIDSTSTPPPKKARIQEEKVELRRVWHDPDDDIPDEEGISGRRVKTLPRSAEPYRVRCVEDFERVFGPTPEWAQLGRQPDKKRRGSLDSDEDDDADAEGFNFGSGRSSGSALPQGQIRLLRVADINGGEQRREGHIIRSVAFSDKNAVSLVVGATGVVSLYQVDGVNNPHLQSVTIENFHVGGATFSSCGGRVFVSSSRLPHFYAICLATGALTRVRPSAVNSADSVKRLVVTPDGGRLVSVGGRGSLYILSENTGEVVNTLEIPGDVRDIAFAGKNQLLALNGEGSVFVFDWRSSRAVAKVIPEGIFDPTSLAVSSQGLLAVGSRSGIVSILKQGGESWEPKPIAEFGNLTTEISELSFNGTGEILAIASTEKDNAVRLVHMSSLTVFPGFPHVAAQWGRPNCLAFSPGSGFLAVGNNKGRALLFRLRHFGSY